MKRVLETQRLSCENIASWTPDSLSCSNFSALRL